LTTLTVFHPARPWRCGDLPTPSPELMDSMTTLQAAPAASPKFDNNGQYSRTGILRYEKIFGAGYVSTGGHATTEDLCARLGPALRPGARVLDVGSGIGGAPFHPARAYGPTVAGIDLGEGKDAIAAGRASQHGGGHCVA